MGKKYNI